MMYEGFARAYDYLMADVDYDAWAERYLMLAAEFCDDVLTAVDCACGTGALTVRLAEKGIAVTGVDISEEMLRIAGGKRPQAWTTDPVCAAGYGAPFRA